MGTGQPILSTIRGIIVRYLIVFAIAVMSLTGCQTRPLYDIGSGPVVLSKTTASGFNRYLSRTDGNPTLFVISTDGGNWSSLHCPGFNCRPNNGDDSIKSCNSRAKNRGHVCKIFALGRDIVWKGPVSFPRSSAGEHTFALTRKNPDGPGWITFSGTAIFKAGDPEIYLALKWRGVDCRGVANKKTEAWFIDCSGTREFSGTFVSGSNNLYEGIGKDNGGEQVDFAIQKIRTISHRYNDERSKPNPAATLNAKELCSVALDPYLSSSWSTQDHAKDFVTEAKVRGFDPAYCRDRVKNISPASMGAIELCDKALDSGDATSWSSSANAQAYVQEAKRRGFSLDRCKADAAKAQSGDYDRAIDRYFFCVLPDGEQKYMSKRRCEAQSGSIRS